MIAMRRLRIFTLLSFCNTLGIILVSPFESFEDNALVRLLPVIFGVGCVIQFTALFFARKALKKMDIAAKMRTSYIIVLSFSLALSIIWVLITIGIYWLSHLFDDFGPLSFGHM